MELKKETRILCALVCLTYAQTLRFGLFQDDLYLILQNPLLNSWASLPTLLSSGYWESSQGYSVPIHEFRPLTLLTFFLQVQTTGHAPWALHLVNVLLHCLNTLALYALLKRIIPAAQALWACAFFSVLAVHAETVTHVASRSELLAALFVLLAWVLWLDKRFLAAYACYALGLLSKETASLFPALILLFERTGNRGEPAKAAIHAGLWVIVALYLLMRVVILEHPIRGGIPYFAETAFWVKWLTLSKFWFRYYLIPMATGLGSGLEFRRPFFPDASLLDPVGIILLFSWAGALLASIYALWQRQAWGFWFMSAVLFLLPTSHLIFELDTLGAERFLYLPSISWCLFLGWLAYRHKHSLRVQTGLLTLLSCYSFCAVSNSFLWKNAESFYSQVLQDNPASASAWLSLGMASLEKNPTQAEAYLRKAMVLQPDWAGPYYNLGRWKWEQGRVQEARTLLEQVLQRAPKDPDALVLMGLLEEQRNFLSAMQFYQKALQIRPWDPNAHWNLARLYALQGKRDLAKEHGKKFLKLSPKDPQASELHNWLNPQEVAAPADAGLKKPSQ